jgi:transcriptional regulator with XRE-family HTH domain
MARDETWRSAVGTWGRLKWARKRKFETAKDAAIAMGEEPGTYRAYEREPHSSKHVPLPAQKAFHFAKRLGVRWEWLLQGEGAPWREEDERLEKIRDAYEGVSDERKEEIAEAIVRLLKAG